MSFLKADMKGIGVEYMSHISETSCNIFIAEVLEILVMPSMSYAIPEAYLAVPVYESTHFL